MEEQEPSSITPQKFTDHQKQLEEIFNSSADQEAKMTEFETRIQHVDETEEDS